MTRPGGGAVMARRLWWRGRRAGGSAWPGACALERGRRGVSGERAGEHSRPGIEHGGRQRLSAAARPRQRHSEAASARALKCLRARAEQRGKVSGGERERREEESGERKKLSTP